MEYKFEQIAYNSKDKKKPEEQDRFHYIGLEHLNSDCFEIEQWGAESAPTGEKLLMRKGDVLFGKRRAYQRKVGIAPFDGIFSAHGMVLRPNEGVMDKDFFPFFISSDQFMERAVRISVGGLSPTINWKDLKEQRFDIPSLEDQKKLAKLLWAAYHLKESYKKMLFATDEMVKSQFIELVKSSNPEKKTLASICTRGPQNGFYRKGAEIDGTIPIVKMSQLFGFESMGDVCHFDLVSMTEEELKRFSLTENDLLFGRRSLVPEGAGKCRRAGKVEQTVVFESSILRVSIDPDICYPRFIQAWTESPEGEQAISELRAGTSVVGITGTGLSKVIVPVPTKDIQYMFIRVAEQADKSKYLN